MARRLLVSVLYPVLLTNSLVLSRVTGADIKEEVCSLTLVNGDYTYAVTKTEININKLAFHAHKHGECCYDIYSHPYKKTGDSQTISTNGNSEVLIGMVGSAHQVPCQSYSANVIAYVRYFLYAAIGIVLVLVVATFCRLGLLNPKVNPWLYRLGKLNGRQKETGLLSGQNGHQRESELVSVETGGKNQNEKFIDD